MGSISVIICTNNPCNENIKRVLHALRLQSLPFGHWELILVDNASDRNLANELDLSWHPNARHVREELLGLSHARLRGAREARGDIFVFVDDDNVLSTDYLAVAKRTMEADRKLGVCGGKSLPLYEAQPPTWFKDVTVSLACNDHGNSYIEFSYEGVPPDNRQFPHGTPAGAGMVLRQDAFLLYVEAAKHDSVRMALGRRGKSLASGEDNDAVLTILEAGYKAAYVPDLVLQHLIPAKRLTPAYLSALGFASCRSWYLLHWIHGLPHDPPMHPLGAVLVMVRDYVRYRAWRSPAHNIRWNQNRGMVMGRVDVHKLTSVGHRRDRR